MSARNCGPPHGLLPPHGNGRPLPPPMQLPPLFEEIRDHQFRMEHPRVHPALMIEERIAAQHDDLNLLLADNQRLAATHVALKQELEHVQHELRRVARISNTIHAENDAQMREVYEKSVKIEGELRGVDAMRNELMHVQGEIKDLSASRQELQGQVQALNQDLSRATADAQQTPGMKAEIETLKYELERARAAVEYEKKGYAENYEHGQAMEKNLVLMAREMEKLRAEIAANAETRLRSAANPAVAGYGGGGGYGANPIYGMNPTGVESFPQYGAAAGGATWGGYEMHQAQGARHI